MIYTITLKEKGTDNEISREYFVDKDTDIKFTGLWLNEMGCVLGKSKEEKF